MTTARALLVAVADGAAEALERARELAQADIDARGGRLALQVLSGDAFALARAVELARIVPGWPVAGRSSSGRTSTA